MFNLHVLQLLGLTSLFVQAFIAWIFVAGFSALREEGWSFEPYKTFQRAFLALATSLTIVSVRSYNGHLTSANGEVLSGWSDGDPKVVACYAAYMGLKAAFAVWLLAGTYQVRGVKSPRTFWIWGIIAIASLTFAPLAVARIDDLLIVQAPIMIGCALIAMRNLTGHSVTGSGLRIVRWSLVGLALTWLIHAGAAATRSAWNTQYVLSLNSLIDLGVQLGLGLGLSSTLLQEAHRRMTRAEQERETLARSIVQDDKLRALGTVVSGVAHELNNPLTVILGYAEELQLASPDNAEATTILEQAERCRGIVRNLSALARQSIHPRQELEIEPLVRRVTRGLSAEASRANVRLTVEPMNDLTAAVDRIGIEQVLSNLVINGVHACDHGGTVTLSGRRLRLGIELSATDTGSGISPKDSERLFEPFFTTKPPGHGTGLGLSIAHAIVRGHDGLLEFEPGPGGIGTRFRIVLPNATAPDATADQVQLPAFDVPRRRLLVIDDDPAVRAIVRAQAKRRGWIVDEAESAEKGLRMDMDVFAAILCDLRMPGIGGIGLNDRLAIERPKVLERTLFFTGDLANPESVSFSNRCQRPVLQKPFDFDQLFQQLAMVGALHTPADASVPTIPA
jgi:signal transduction histidine kinase/ActR/RegA family two-component response regulator